MDEIQEYKEDITENLINYDKLVNKSHLYSSDLKRWKGQCTTLKKQIDKLILTLDDEVKELPASQASHHVGSIKSFRKKLEKTEDEYQRKLRGDSNLSINMEKNDHIAEEKPNAILQTIQRGDAAQERIKEALQSMDRTVEEGISLAAEINLELNKQIEQLDRMTDKVKDTHSSLKRAQKTINYFMKAVQCDKVMLGLLILILLSAIALIVLIVKKNSK